MDKFNEYYDFMDGYLDYFMKVKDNERGKMEALLSNDLKKIEEAMQEHQASVKKIELLEKQRRELSKQLGFGEMNFQEIISTFDGEERKKLSLVRAKLQNTVKSIKYLNKKSLEIAGMQLRYYGELAGNAEEDAHIYNSKGMPELSNSTLLNTKV